MENRKIKAIEDTVYQSIGAHIRGSKSPVEVRKALIFWFENYNRGEGPTFTVRPTGLKRHTVTLKFGAYASPCIDHIESHADPEAYKLAYALVDQLAKEYDLKVNKLENRSDWKVSSDLTIEVNRKVHDQGSTDNLLETISQLMVPLIAAMAELIGYENKDDQEDTLGTNGYIDGTLTRSIVLKRERNPRNRLLCLRVHGEQCGVCGIEPKSIYGPDLGGILEVHHIEPLSEIEAPKAYSPSEDLIPLCPNCHRAIHKRKPALLPNELKERLN